MKRLLEQRVESERVNHGWCIGVVSYGNGGLGEGNDGDGDYYACLTMPGGVGHKLVDFEAIPECELKTLMTPVPSAFHERSCGY